MCLRKPTAPVFGTPRNSTVASSFPGSWIYNKFYRFWANRPKPDSTDCNRFTRLLIPESLCSACKVVFSLFSVNCWPSAYKKSRQLAEIGMKIALGVSIRRVTMQVDALYKFYNRKFKKAILAELILHVLYDPTRCSIQLRADTIRSMGEVSQAAYCIRKCLAVIICYGTDADTWPSTHGLCVIVDEERDVTTAAMATCDRICGECACLWPSFIWALRWKLRTLIAT